MILSLLLVVVFLLFLLFCCITFYNKMLKSSQPSPRKGFKTNSDVQFLRSGSSQKLSSTPLVYVSLYIFFYVSYSIMAWAVMVLHNFLFVVALYSVCLFTIPPNLSSIYISYFSINFLVVPVSVKFFKLPYVSLCVPEMLTVFK